MASPIKREVTITTDSGDIYEAVSLDGGPWEISYPEGADRFHGTIIEVVRHIRLLIEHGTSAKISAGRR